MCYLDKTLHFIHLRIRMGSLTAGEHVWQCNMSSNVRRTRWTVQELPCLSELMSVSLCLCTFDEH